MRHFHYILVTVVIACNKDDGQHCQTPSSESDHCGVVSGITARDIAGGQMATGDADDWQQTDDWCPAVEALFDSSPTVTYTSAPADSLLVAAFPNPTPNGLFLGAYRDDPSYMDLRLVDAQHHLLWSMDSIWTDAQMFNLLDLGATPGAIVRFYYRVVHADGTAHRGHGDVQVGS